MIPGIDCIRSLNYSALPQGATIPSSEPPQPPHACGAGGNRIFPDISQQRTALSDSVHGELHSVPTVNLASHPLVYHAFKLWKYFRQKTYVSVYVSFRIAKRDLRDKLIFN